MKQNGNKHRPKFTPQLTWAQFERLFPNEEACREYLFSHRWPEKVICPRCHKSEQVYKIAQPWKWECFNHDCARGHAYRFSLIAGTIFENTKYPLRTWFWVLFLMLTSKKGISALQIHRVIGSGSYKTAFYICHRLRAAMNDPEFRQLMEIVEVDETHIGGSNRNRHWDKKVKGTGTAGKIPVIGAIARKGSVVAMMIENTDTATLTRFVRQIVSNKVDLVATHEHSGYRYIKWVMPHDVISHSKGEYVRGTVHTQNIESFWSLLKRGIIGTYHNVRKKYLPLYLAEFSFRFNNRNNADIFGTVLARC